MGFNADVSLVATGSSEAGSSPAARRLVPAGRRSLPARLTAHTAPGKCWPSGCARCAIYAQAAPVATTRDGTAAGELAGRVACGRGCRAPTAGLHQLGQIGAGAHERLRGADAQRVSRHTALHAYGCCSSGEDAADGLVRKRVRVVGLVQSPAAARDAQPQWTRGDASGLAPVVERLHSRWPEVQRGALGLLVGLGAVQAQGSRAVGLRCDVLEAQGGQLRYAQHGIGADAQHGGVAQPGERTGGGGERGGGIGLSPAHPGDLAAASRCAARSFLGGQPSQPAEGSRSQRPAGISVASDAGPSAEGGGVYGDGARSAAVVVQIGQPRGDNRVGLRRGDLAEVEVDDTSAGAPVSEALEAAAVGAPGVVGMGGVQGGGDALCVISAQGAGTAGPGDCDSGRNAAGGCLHGVSSPFSGSKAITLIIACNRIASGSSRCPPCSCFFRCGAGCSSPVSSRGWPLLRPVVRGSRRGRQALSVVGQHCRRTGPRTATRGPPP